jgi:hypothetical protein
MGRTTYFRQIGRKDSEDLLPDGGAQPRIIRHRINSGPLGITAIGLGESRRVKGLKAEISAAETVIQRERNKEMPEHQRIWPFSQRPWSGRPTIAAFCFGSVFVRRCRRGRATGLPARFSQGGGVRSAIAGVSEAKFRARTQAPYICVRSPRAPSVASLADVAPAGPRFAQARPPGRRP